MYSLIFAIILCIILGWKSFKLFANKKKAASFEELDAYLLNELNEGDHDEQ